MPQNFPFRVLIADDHQSNLDYLLNALHSDSSFTVAGAVKNGDELITAYFKLLPDLVVTDIAMPGCSGINAVRKIKEKDDKLKALFFSMHFSEAMFRTCIQAGGQGLLSKDCFEDELINAVKIINSGNFYFRKPLDISGVKEIFKKVLSGSEQEDGEYHPLDRLNNKEIEFFRLIGNGLTIDEICDRLGKDSRTYHFHHKNIMEKLGIESSQKLISVAAKFLRDESLGLKI